MTSPGSSSELVAGPDGSACVTLPESPTTGYRWQLEDASKAAHLVRSDYAQTGAARAGGAGTRTFCLHLRGLAVLDLAFVLRRDWEPRIVERYVVTVRKP